MIATLTRLYKKNGENVLTLAVKKGWITEAQKITIMEG